MKNLLLFTLLFFFAFAYQKPEPEFSCDPVINKFVIENKEELATISVRELSAYDFQLQRAVFSSWDYQKKRSSWIDKLQYVLTRLSFTEVEKTHVQALIDHISKDYFLKENLKNNSKIQSQFAAQWVRIAATKLGWSDQFIAFMVYRLYTTQSQFDTELSFLKSLSIMNSANSEGTCSCSVSADFCGGRNCNSGGCSGTSGCGWLWSMSCDGTCY